MRVLSLHFNVFQILSTAKVSKTEKNKWLRKIKHRDVKYKNSEFFHDIWILFSNDVFLLQTVDFVNDLKCLFTHSFLILSYWKKNYLLINQIQFQNNLTKGTSIEYAYLLCDDSVVTYWSIERTINA